MDTFCDDPDFWNETFRTDSNVTFTQFFGCVHHTVGGVGRAWLLLASPAYLWYLCTFQGLALSLPVSWLYRTKLAITVVQLALCIQKVMVQTDAMETNTYPLHKVTMETAIEGFTLVMVMLLVEMERRRGSITSGVMFIYWCLETLTSVARLWLTLSVGGRDTDTSEFATAVIISVQLIICCVPERLPDVAGKQPCPESRCSFLSRITYGWINGLRRLGYERPLTEDDLFDLNQSDKSETVVPRFEQNWKNAERKLHRNDNISGCQAMNDSPANRKTTKDNVSLVKVVLKTFGIELMLAWAWGVPHLALESVFPFLLRHLIDAVEDPTIASWKGYLVCFGFLCDVCTHTMLYNHLHSTLYPVNMRIQAALTSAVFKKSLTMTHKARSQATAGEIVNMISVDVDDIFQFGVWSSWEMVAAPLRLIIIMTFLYYTVGGAMWAGLGVLVVMVPLNHYLAIKMEEIEKELKEHGDNRMKLITEVLNGIKILKLYAWDMVFADKVTTVRDRELSSNWNMATYDAISSFAWAILPFCVTLSTLATYTFLVDDHVVGAQTVFVALALFIQLAETLNSVPYIFTEAIKTKVCLARVEEFLHHEDIDSGNVTHDESDDAVTIKDATFAWNTDIGTCLKNISLTVPKGNLVAIVGSVGSGKSSLISAILGEMDKLSGDVNVSGRTAYVPQQAWIQNASVRDNILFGHPVDEEKYNHIIDACSLIPDIEVLPARDLSEIGEKGINLSGGQKQRISLARAVYFNSDIYLLDDPLSAVDSHVGKHIFENVIGPDGILRNKTRLLVTHGIRWLPSVDRIVVVQEGTMTETGTYDELMTHDGPFAKFMTQYVNDKDNLDSSDSDEEVAEFKKRTLDRLHSIRSQEGTDVVVSDDHIFVERSDFTCDVIDGKYTTNEYETDTPLIVKRQHSKSKDVSNAACNQPTTSHGSATKSALGHIVDTTDSLCENVAPVDGKLIEDEELETGEIRWKVIISYIAAFGYNMAISVICLYAMTDLLEVLASSCLEQWTSVDDKEESMLWSEKHERNDINMFYLTVYGIICISHAIFTLAKSLISRRADTEAAETLHRNMLLNVLRSPMSFFDTTPVGRIVNRFSGDIETVDYDLPADLKYFVTCLMIFVSSFSVIFYTAPAVIFTILPIGVLYYILHRKVLPAKRQSRRLEAKTRSPIYNNLSESLYGVSVIRAFGMQDRFIKQTHERVDLNQTCNFVNIILDRWLFERLECLGGLIMFSTATIAMYNRDSVSGPLIGMTMGWVFHMQGHMASFLDVLAKLQLAFVNVERIEQYTNIPSEAALKTDHVPRKDWPECGGITLDNYSVRYRDGLDLVLRNIDLSVRPGEKIGIVGRTGAGKSSLALSLFRLLEPATGSISIDGQDVSQLGLHDLRSRLTILPQDPVLFSGSLRMNIDPLDEHTDAAIFTALEHAHLFSFVESLPGQLQYDCGEGGNNLSVGQRQLVCLARSLLRKSKVLVLDEATAAVDMETDDLIQQTIRSEFKDSTVLTIAHRINTVMDYDRILVLERGEVREFDAPTTLLRNPRSLFSQLAKDAGLI